MGKRSKRILSKPSAPKMKNYKDRVIELKKQIRQLESFGNLSIHEQYEYEKLTKELIELQRQFGYNLNSYNAMYNSTSSYDDLIDHAYQQKAIPQYNPNPVKPVIKKDIPTEAEEAAELVKKYFSLTDSHGLYKTDSEEIVSEQTPNNAVSNHDIEYRTERCFSRLYADGSKVFWIKRKHTSEPIKHNLKGPAVIYENKSVEYWIAGQQFSEINFNMIQNGMLLK